MANKHHFELSGGTGAPLGPSLLRFTMQTKTHVPTTKRSSTCGLEHPA